MSARMETLPDIAVETIFRGLNRKTRASLGSCSRHFRDIYRRLRFDRNILCHVRDLSASDSFGLWLRHRHNLLRHVCFAGPLCLMSVKDLARTQHLTVQSIHLSGNGSVDRRGNKLASFSTLAALTRLSFDNVVLSQESLSSIGKAVALQSLQLRNCRVTFFSFLFLHSLTGLKTLVIDGHSNDNAFSVYTVYGLKALRRLEHLVLDVDGFCPGLDLELSYLTGLTSLCVGSHDRRRWHTNTGLAYDNLSSSINILPRLKHLCLYDGRLSSLRCATITRLDVGLETLLLSLPQIDFELVCPKLNSLCVYNASARPMSFLEVRRMCAALRTMRCIKEDGKWLELHLYSNKSDNLELSAPGWENVCFCFPAKILVRPLKVQE
jgi:hypothetical protein